MLAQIAGALRPSAGDLLIDRCGTLAVRDRSAMSRWPPRSGGPTVAPTTKSGSGVVDIQAKGVADGDEGERPPGLIRRKPLLGFREELVVASRRWVLLKGMDSVLAGASVSGWTFAALSRPSLPCSTEGHEVLAVQTSWITGSRKGSADQWSSCSELRHHRCPWGRPSCDA